MNNLINSMKKTDRKKQISKSYRADIIFPITRLARLIKENKYAERVST